MHYTLHTTHYTLHAVKLSLTSAQLRRANESSATLEAQLAESQRRVDELEAGGGTGVCVYVCVCVCACV
jgi:hypothetical protein